MEFAWLSVPTPLVPLTVAATDDGLACVSFDGSGATVRSLARHGGVRPASASDVLAASASDVLAASASDVLAGAAGQQIAEWASGRRQVFDLPIDWSLTSGPQERVLRTLYETVPFGTTITYGELAARSGLPDGSARLVGQIMGSNPIPVVVPCHRVLASDGLGGYGPGIELKRRILVLEGVLQPSLFD